MRGLKYSQDGLMHQLTFDDSSKSISQRINNSFFETQPRQLCSKTISITNQKYKDLQSQKSLIPKDYHPFNDNLAYTEQ